MGEDEELTDRMCAMATILSAGRRKLSVESKGPLERGTPSGLQQSVTHSCNLRLTHYTLYLRLVAKICFDGECGVLK